jgi:hypothetical protein
MAHECFRHGPSLRTKLTLSVRVAMWIREPGSGPPHTYEPIASRAPPKALASQARLVAPHTQTSLAHWNPSRAGLTSQTRMCMGTLSFETPANWWLCVYFYETTESEEKLSCMSSSPSLIITHCQMSATSSVYSKLSSSSGNLLLHWQTEDMSWK